MSNGYWRTKKQSDLSKNGSTITCNIHSYINTWKQRCYDDLPEELPDKLMKSKRAPSYKAIAMAILKNDHSLQSLGFSTSEPKWVYELVKNNA